MAYNYRGRRVAYDNIAVGEATGRELTISMSTQQDNVETVTDVSLYNAYAVSVPGNRAENLTAGSSDLGTFNNIANAVLPGIEDNDNANADKFTSEGETITDTPSVD